MFASENSALANWKKTLCLLSFTDVSKTCTSFQFLTSQTRLLMCDNKILVKMSELSVLFEPDFGLIYTKAAF